MPRGARRASPSRGMDERRSAGRPARGRLAYEGGRRRRKRRRSIPGCLAVLVALAVVVGGFWFGVSKGVDLLRTSSPTPRTTPAPARAGSSSRSRRATRSPRWAAASRTQGVVASVQAFLNAAPGRARLDRHPGRLLQAARRDAGRRRARRPARPREHPQEHRHDPRGADGRRHPGDAGEEDRLLRASSTRRCSTTRTGWGCPTTPRATPRATCSPRRTTSGRTETPTADAQRDGRPLAAGRRRRRPRGARRGARLHARTS